MPPTTFAPKLGGIVAVVLGLIVLAIPSVELIRDVGRSGHAHLGVVPRLEIVRGRAAFKLDLVVALAGPLDGSVGLGGSVTWRQ